MPSRRFAPLTFALLAATQASAAITENTLSTVVVTAKGYDGDLLATPNAVEILAPASGAAVAGALFVGEPGLAAHVDGAWGQNPVLRGLKKESVLVLVDGVRVNSAQPVGAIASFLDLGLLERAEVVKGPTSVLYGSGVMGGVVNLITPAAAFRDQPGWEGRFTLGAGSADHGLNGAVVGRYGNAGHALVLGAAVRETDDYRAPGGKVARSGYRSDSLLLKSRHRLRDDASLSLNLQRHADHDV